MSRYTGPKWRINRRENATVLGSSEKWRRRPATPGQHASTRRPVKDYSIQFREKQRVKRIYGMTEKQFRRFYKTALKTTGNTSTKLLQMLEMRADSVLFKLGFAQTISQARQFITHGHVKLNGKKHDIPSSVLKAGDELTVSEGLLNNNLMQEFAKRNKAYKVPAWLNALAKGGKILAEPTRDEIDSSIKERLIIELYSR